MDPAYIIFGSLIILLLAMIFAMIKYPLARKIGIALLGLGFLVCGIVWLSLSNEPELTATESSNLVMLGIATSMVGVLILIALFAVQSLKKQRNRENLNRQPRYSTNQNIAPCLTCHSAIKPNDTFCPGCGTELTNEFTNFHCPKCNGSITIDDAFCRNCGKLLIEK